MHGAGRVKDRYQNFTSNVKQIEAITLTSISPEIKVSRFSDDFHGKRSYLIRLISINIKSKTWRLSL